MSRPSYTAPPKDPTDIEDYGLDCTPWLGEGEEITAQAVTADDPALVISGLTQVAGVVRWRASGGTLGRTHMMTVRVTANSGRRAERTVAVLVIDL